MSYTPISKMTDNLNIISGLPNRPSDGGYNATTLKAAFDEAANAIKNYINGHTVNSTYVNGLVDELNAKLEAIEEDVSDFLDLQLPPGSIKTAMIDDLQVTEGKLSNNAVTRNKILDGEVVAGKLGSKAVQAGNIDDGAVDTAQIAAGAVTFDKTFGAQKQIGLIQNIQVPSSSWFLDADLGCWRVQITRPDETNFINMSRMLFIPTPGSVSDYNQVFTKGIRIGRVTQTKFDFFAYSQPSATVGLECLIFY